MKTFFATAGLLILPAVASAQTGIQGVIETVGNLINSAIPLVLALAVLWFFWGLAQFVFNQGSEDKRAEGRNIMIYGIIALFVMVSVWGLIALVQETFGLDNNNTAPPVPQITI